MLNQAGIKLAWESFGRWNLYYFKEWGLRQKYLENHRGFWWTGFGVLQVSPAVWEKLPSRLGSLEMNYPIPKMNSPLPRSPFWTRIKAKKDEVVNATIHH